MLLATRPCGCETGSCGPTGQTLIQSYKRPPRVQSWGTGCPTFLMWLTGTVASRRLELWFRSLVSDLSQPTARRTPSPPTPFPPQPHRGHTSAGGISRLSCHSHQLAATHLQAHSSVGMHYETICSVIQSFVPQSRGMLARSSTGSLAHL